MKGGFQNGCGQSKGARSRGVSGDVAIGQPHFTLLAQFGVAAGLIPLQDGLQFIHSFRLDGKNES